MIYLNNHFELLEELGIFSIHLVQKMSSIARFDAQLVWFQIWENSNHEKIISTNDYNQIYHVLNLSLNCVTGYLQPWMSHIVAEYYSMEHFDKDLELGLVSINRN